MERYRILPHTADAKFEAFGRTLEEAFGNAALALASLMWDWAAVTPSLSRLVRIRGRDHEQLLVKFLGEVLYLFETQGFLLAGVSGLSIRKSDKGTDLKAELRGDDLSHGYAFHAGVKAITYNEMSISRDDGVRLQVVVDV